MWSLSTASGIHRRFIANWKMYVPNTINGSRKDKYMEQESIVAGVKEASLDEKKEIVNEALNVASSNGQGEELVGDLLDGASSSIKNAAVAKTVASPTVTLVRNGPLNTACRTLIEESSGCEADQAALQGAENRSCLAQVMRSGTVD